MRIGLYKDVVNVSISSHAVGENDAYYLADTAQYTSTNGQQLCAVSITL